MTQFVGVQQISAGTDDSKQVGSQGIRGVLIGNESGLSTVIYMDGTSDSKSLYPGTVDFFPITGGFSGTVKWKTQALLNNVAQWPSSFLQFDTVGINEPFNVSVYPLTLPRLTNVGNSIPVSTNVNAISNEGNPINTEVIDTGPAGNAKMLDIFNDHFIWSVVQAGVAHQVLQGQIAGNPLLIGQAGDISEVLGKLTVDGISSLDNGALKTDGSGNFNAIGSKTTLNGSIAGNLQYSFPFWGTGIKLMIVTLHGYNSALKNIPLPSSLSRGWIVATDLGGGSPVLQPKIGVTLVGFNAITALGGAGNGTQSSVSNIKQDSMGSINSTIDNFDFTPGGVADGTIIMIGH